MNRESVIDDETGLIQRVSEIPVGPGEPAIFNFSVKMANTGRYHPVRCYDRNGGAGLSREAGRLAAIGEAIERYCGSVYYPDELPLGSARSMRKLGRVVGPKEIPLFHERQQGVIHYPRFTEASKLCWARGYSLTRQEPVLLPACLVYIPYHPFRREAGEVTIAPGISTGQASAFTYDDALVAGISEVVERDAFSIFWANRLSLPKIDLKSDPRVDEVFRRVFDRTNLEYACYDMTTDLEIPAIVCLLIDRSRSPPMICTGGAAGTDPGRVALKAMLEAAQTRVWARYIGREGKVLEVAEDFSNVNDFEKHVHLYAYGDMMRAVEFLIKDPKIIPLRNPSSGAGPVNPLRFLLQSLRRSGHEVFAVDLTTPDVGTCGFRVVKVMIPSLQPLEGDHTHRFLGGSRLYVVPGRLGYAARPRYETMNPDPHPYP
ncbi:MAG TPA: YcaO-like family protein [Thermoplasmata archaeon]|nr:YcaO-like family protein [Thermoplasmata archaeon]